VGGLGATLDEIRRRILLPLSLPKAVAAELGAEPPRGMVFHGPPGCGKSMLAGRLSALLSARPPTIVNGPEVLERFVGASEENVREIFSTPPPCDDDGAPHIIILDEMDAIAGRRGNGGDSDRVRDSVVNQLLALLDGVKAPDAADSGTRQVGTTTIPYSYYYHYTTTNNIRNN